ALGREGDEAIADRLMLEKIQQNDVKGLLSHRSRYRHFFETYFNLLWLLRRSGNETAHLLFIYTGDHLSEPQIPPSIDQIPFINDLETAKWFYDKLKDEITEEIRDEKGYTGYSNWGWS